MAFGTITVTESTFGSISGTVIGAVPGTLSGSVGVPGPQGPAGPTGPQGPAGAAGVGVPAGGTTGQALVKTSNSDYATGWTTLNLTQYLEKANNLSDLTNVGTARNNLGLGVGSNVTFGSVTATSSMTSPSLGSPEGNDYYSISNSLLQVGSITYGFTDPNIPSAVTYSSLTNNSLNIWRRTWATEEDWNDDIINTQQRLTYDLTDGFGTLTFLSQASVASSPVQLSIKPTGITFPNASVQTIAFPGFNNAALTGNSTAVTAALGDNDTSIATTAFVQQELLSGTANARNLEVQVRNQSGSTIPAGSIVYISGATGNLPLITLAQANNDANSAQTIGFVKTAIANNGTGYVIVRGVLDAIDTSALSEGVQLYLSPSTAGTWTTTKPSAPQHLVYVGIVIRSHPTLGTILVSVQNGFEVAELHDSAISSPANNDLFVYELSTDLWKNKSFATLGLATLASPTFTGTPSLPTGTTAVTQSAGNNTTALATTAFVQQEVPAASTTAAGKVELATNAEAQNGSSTTLGMTPSTVAYAKSSPNYFRLTALSGAAATLGAGASANVGLVGGWNPRAPTSVAGYGIVSFFGTFLSRGSSANAVAPLQWNKRFVTQFRMHPRTLGTDSNTVNRICFGKSAGNIAGDLTLRGIEIRQIANGPLELLVHNGTTLTAVTSSFTPSTTTASDIRIESDGAGNVTLFSNDSQIATTSAGPTTTGTSNNSFITFESENLATITGTSNGMYVAEISYEFAL